MTKKKSKQPAVRPYRGWLLSNYGHPWTVVNRREQAKAYAEDHAGEPWEHCQKYCQITRVEVKPV